MAGKCHQNFFVKCSWLPDRQADAQPATPGPNIDRQNCHVSVGIQRNPETRDSVFQRRPFDLSVFRFRSTFSRGPKRLTFYFQVLWASEEIMSFLRTPARAVPTKPRRTLVGIHGFLFLGRIKRLSSIATGLWHRRAGCGFVLGRARTQAMQTLMACKAYYVQLLPFWAS